MLDDGENVAHGHVDVVDRVLPGRPDDVLVPLQFVAGVPQVVGGPEILPMHDLVREWKRAAGVRGVVAPIRLPGGLGRFWRAGENLVPDHRDGTITFTQWLAERTAG